MALLWWQTLFAYVPVVCDNNLKQVAHPGRANRQTSMSK